jgi:NhaC family Na+:H+ antiporter
LTFAPFCFFCWISPLMTIIFGLFGIMIAKMPPESSRETSIREN